MNTRSGTGRIFGHIGDSRPGHATSLVLPELPRHGYHPTMMILLPALGVTFAAFCVWLTVRFVNRRERWAKWTSVGMLASLPLIYVLSVGPAVAWNRSHRDWEIVNACYRPIFLFAAHHPESHGLLRDYIHLCGVPKRCFPLITTSGGIIWITD